MNACVGWKAVSVALLSGVLVGCGEPADDPNGATTLGDSSTMTTGTSTTGASTTGAPAGCLSATAEDGSLSFLVDTANNYAFKSEVTLNVVQVAPNTPLNFDWSSLSIDITQQPINLAAGEVKAVMVALLDLSVADFQTKLNANEKLDNYSSGALALYPTTQTAANMYDFGAPGTLVPLAAEYIDPFLDPAVNPPATHTFAVLIQDDTSPGRDVRMVQAVQIEPTSLNADVVITNDSSTLRYETDLNAVVPVQVPRATSNITADWRHLQDVANNALGSLWTARQVDEVMVARYALTPAELTAQFLALETIALESYRAPVEAGAKLNLSALTEVKTAAPFPGINADGTWVFALFCSKCTNPAPWFLTILQACP